MRIFKRNKPGNEQDILVYYLERIINIAKVKTEIGDNQAVKNILSTFVNVFKKFLELQKSNPSKFKALLLDKDFYNNYVKQIAEKEKEASEDPTDAKAIEDLKLESSFKLSFEAEKQLKGLTIFLRSFKNIWEIAIGFRRSEISNYICHQLSWILSKIVSDEGNGIIIEQFLKLFNEITWEGIKGKDKEIDSSLFTASINWYLDVVFLERYYGEEYFQLSYLEDFDEHFIRSIKYIILDGENRLYQGLVSYLITGGYRYSHFEDSIYSLEPFIMDKDNNLYKKHKSTISNLQERGQLIDSLNDLTIWKESKSNFIESIKGELSVEDYKELNLILDRLSDYFEHLYKTKNLKNIIFIMGAFCWYKKRIDYIKYLWEYKQPPDSDTTWLGPAILPDTIGQLIEYYFNTDFEEKLRLFRDDRHGIRIYFDEFFILFLLRYSVLSYSSNNNVRSHLGSYILQDFKSHILSDIINSVPKLIDVNNGLIEKKNIILELGFKEEEIQRTLTKTIPDFLNKIKGQAEKQLGDKEKITKISGKRIEEFKREFLEEYKSRENESFIEILSHFKNFKDKSNESDYPKNIERKGLNNIIDKAAFFEDWHINYAGFGSEFGRNMASGKDFRTFVDIFERCTVVSDYGGLDRILSEISDIHKSYILLINFSDYRFKEKYAGYIPKWHTEIPSKIDISGFEGIYKFGSYNIPVFGFYFRGLGKNIVVLNSAKLGELIQYNPSKENDEENTREDIFYFNVRVYSDNPDLVDAIIKKPPPWLKEIGDESKQREYLESKALLHVFERYEFKIAPVFEGYKIKIPEERDLL